jgi:hypothetical protein
MTTDVIIEALCGKENEVLVEIYEDDTLQETTILQDKESMVFYIYDDRELRTRERLKE